ncbi:MAG: AraC family transcriptional regulator ligand-binding domain-containing protein [Steroidobacteraceae bacterium]
MPASSLAAPVPTIELSVVRSLCDALQSHSPMVNKGLEKFAIPHPAQMPARGVSVQRVPMKNYLAWFDWLAQELRQPLLGLELSQRVGAEMMGAVGYLFLSAVNLQVALRNLARYTSAIQDASVHDVDIVDDHLQFTYRIADQQLEPRRQDVEFSIGFVWRLVQLFSSRSCPLARVDFEQEKPALGVAAYGRIFEAPVLFGQPANRLYIHRNALRTPSRRLDPHLFPILEAHVREHAAKYGHADSFTWQVRSCLSEDKMQGGARAPDIARQLGLSESTLQRRLRNERTSFKRLQDEAAKDLAGRWIRQPSISIATIARRLGYAESACLTRAFRRWFGMTPRRYRRFVLRSTLEAPEQGRVGGWQASV